MAAMRRIYSDSDRLTTFFSMKSRRSDGLKATPFPTFMNVILRRHTQSRRVFCFIPNTLAASGIRSNASSSWVINFS